MSSAKTVLAAAAFSLAAAVPAAATDHAAAIAQILAIEKIIAYAHGVTPLLPYLDKDMVFDDIAPGRVLGAAAFLKDIKAQFANFKTLNDTIQKIDVDADGDVGFAYSLQNVAITTTQNQAISVNFRQVDCYHKVGGKWLLVYENLSVPVDTATGKAVFNAAP